MAVATDYVIANGTGTAVLADLNSVFGAIVTNNSSNSEPPTKYPYMLWADTSANLLKIRNSGNDAWITLFTLAGGVDVDADSTFGGTIKTTGNQITIEGVAPVLTFTETNDNPDYQISGNGGALTFKDTTNNVERLKINSNGNIQIPNDSARLRIGASQDLDIFHHGGNSSIANNTGTLLIHSDNLDLRPNTNSGEVYLRCTQNGSVELRFDSVKKFETTANGIDVTGQVKADEIYLLDNEVVKVGTGGDLQILHNGSDSFVRDLGTGGLYMTGSVVGIRNSGANEDGLLFAENGAIQLFFDHSLKLQTTSTGIKTLGNTQANQAIAQVLHSNESQGVGIAYNGIHSIGSNTNVGLDIRSKGSGVIKLQSSANEDMAIFTPDGSVELKHNNLKKFETTSSGVTVSGGVAATAFSVGDGQEIKLGDSNDLKLFHNGSHSYIADVGTGDLRITGSAIHLQNAGQSENMLKSFQDGAVELYFDNAKKFQTTSTGAFVTGRLDIGNSSWAYPKTLNVQGSSGSILALRNNDTTSYAADTNTSIELSLNTGNTGNQTGSCEIRAVKTNGTNGNNERHLSFYTGVNGGSPNERLRIKSGGDIHVTGDKGIFLGANNDLMLAHDGSSTRIEDTFGFLAIKSNAIELRSNTGSELYIKNNLNAAVELYFDNSKKAETTTNGFQVSNGNLDIFNTSGGANIRNISSSGSFFIGNPNNGDLALYVQDSTDNNIILQVNTGEKMLECTAGGSTDLYHHGGLKLKTTNLGVEITGTTNSKLSAANGTLILESTNNDVLVEASDDFIVKVQSSETAINAIGNGGVELFFDNSKKFETTSDGATITGVLKVGNNNSKFGQNFLRFEHNGTGFFDHNFTGQDFNFRTSISSSLDTTAFIIKSSGNVQLPLDNAKLQLGASQDLFLEHDGNNSVFRNATGDLYIQDNSAGNIYIQPVNNEASINAFANDRVELAFDGSTKLETLSDGINITGTLKVNGSAISTGGLGNVVEDTSPQLGGTLDTNNQNIEFGDVGDLTQNRLKFGASGDLSIFHNASTSTNFISTIGSNSCSITSERTDFKNGSNNETFGSFIANSAVELYFDNSKKFETTSTGISVSSSGDAIIKVTSADGSAAFLDLGDASDPDGGRIHYDSGSNLVFDTASSERMRINSSGNVGIGTAAPSTSLHISASGSSTQMRIENGNADFLLQAGDAGDDGLHFYDLDNSAYRMMIANSGNVGIGTITPAKKLDVSGEIRATGILFGSDTAAANTLEDYEEGVFTPSLEFGGATTGITYSSMRGGSYVKIGRQVTVNFGFTLTSKGSASGDATIAGLPFAVESLLSSTSVEASGVSSFWNDVATNSANIVFAATNSSSELQIRHTVGAEDDTDDMQESDFENNTAIRGSITYFTAT